MPRLYQYAEYPNLVTGETLTPVTLPFTSNAGDVYFLFMNTSAGTDVGGIFTVFESAYIFDHQVQPRTVGDFQSCPMFFPQTLGAGANNFNYSLSGTKDSGSNILSMRQSGIFALKVDPLDFYNTNWDSGVNVTSASYVTVKTLTINAPTDGDYLILTNVSSGNATTTADMNIRFSVDGTAYSDMYHRSNSETFNYGTPYKGMIKLTLTAGSHTILIEAKTSAGTLQIPWAMIIGLRCDTFVNTYYAESRTSTNSTAVDPTYTTKVTLTQVTNYAPHLLFTSALGTESIQDQGVHQRTQLDGVNIQANLNGAVYAESEFIHSALSSSVLGSDSHTVTIQVAKKTTGAGTGIARIADAAICLLELPAPPVVNILGGLINGANIL